MRSGWQLGGNMGSKQDRLDTLVRQRFAESKGQRENSRTCIYKQMPREAEPDKTRALNVAKRMGAESMQGDTNDFLASWFLSLGAKRSRPVCIIRSSRGSPLGSGFLITPRLLITNHHVLENELMAKSAIVEFDYAEDDQALAMSTTRYSLRPDMFWLFNDTEQLDFSIVAVGERLSGSVELKDFGYLPLSDRPDKHALGLHANVIQHPLGGQRQVVVRENRLLARDIATERCLHYSADTDEGSSGSPVFNDAWEVVALHHWGIPHLDTVTVNGIEVPVTVNEGIRTSVIVEQLRKELVGLNEGMATLLREALDLGENVSAGAAAPKVPGKPSRPPAAEQGGERMDIVEGDEQNSTPRTTPADETTVGAISKHIIMVPLEISVRAVGTTQFVPRIGPDLVPNEQRNGLSGLRFAERVRRDTNYSNRNGYRADFIDDLNVEIADIARPRALEVAPLLDGTTGVEAVLNYQNFSVIVCQPRRLALFTATNINAKRYVAVDRDTGEPRVGPEGESWYDDDRMDPEHYIGQAWYSEWSNYFDRGHLTRRTDPTWGTELQATRANADTYHRTNCSPQHFRFNQSIRFWQGLERYVLEHGVLKTKERMTVLNGPVLNDEFSECDDVQVPLAYWKVLLRTGPDGEPKASAFLANQELLLEEVRRYIARPVDTDVPKIDAFRCSLSVLESTTGLNFSAFAKYDTFKKKKGPEGMDAGHSRMADWSDAL